VARSCAHLRESLDRTENPRAHSSAFQHTPEYSSALQRIRIYGFLVTYRMLVPDGHEDF